MSTAQGYASEGQAPQPRPRMVLEVRPDSCIKRFNIYGINLAEVPVFEPSDPKYIEYEKQKAILIEDGERLELTQDALLKHFWSMLLLQSPELITKTMIGIGKNWIIYHRNP